MMHQSVSKILVLTDYKIVSEQGAAFERLRCYNLAHQNSEWNFVIHDKEWKVTAQKRPLTRMPKAWFLIEESNRTSSKFYSIVGKYLDFLSPWKTISEIINLELDAKQVLIYTSNFYLLLWALIRLQWMQKRALVIEKNEMEFAIILNQFSLRSISGFLLSITILPFRLVLAIVMDMLTCLGSKIISISTSIHRLYGSKSVLIPILVDLNRFTISKKVITNSAPRGVYIGEITLKKDGLFEWVELLASSRCPFHVDIIGNGTKANRMALQQTISRCGLDDRIHLLDSITAKEIENILPSYDFSILLRKSNFQTRYGFSTKLGEYLAADLLVFYTDVSDNSLYLGNSSQVMLDMTNHEGSIKRWDESIQNLIARGRNVGESREIARSHFDYSNYKNELNAIFN